MEEEVKKEKNSAGEDEKWSKRRTRLRKRAKSQGDRTMRN